MVRIGTLFLLYLFHSLISYLYLSYKGRNLMICLGLVKTMIWPWLKIPLVENNSFFSPVLWDGSLKDSRLKD